MITPTSLLLLAPLAMSAVSVRVVQSSDVSDAGATAVEESATESAASTSLETFPFSSGNPRIERICGVVHLYRPTPVQAEATGAQGVQPHALPVTDTVCALGVPGGLSVADFCAFVGAMLPRVKDMRIVRDERGKVAASEGTTEKQPGAGHEEVFTYAVLMRFDTPSSAEEFFRFYHGRAVRWLPPLLVPCVPSAFCSDAETIHVRFRCALLHSLTR